MELVFKKRLPEHLLYFLLPGVRALPAVKSGGSNDLIDVLNHIGDDLRSRAVPHLKEYFSERLLVVRNVISVNYNSRRTTIKIPEI